MNYKLYDDLLKFSRLQKESLDVDPAYPILSYLQKDLSPEEAILHTLYYVAWYNLPSAMQAFRDIGEGAKLPTGIERRGLRKPEYMLQHLKSLEGFREVWGGYRDWLTYDFGTDPLVNWERLRNNLEQVRFNGRWASYKTAEILMEVNGFPIEAPDMGNDGSSGPVLGLILLFNDGERPTHITDPVAKYDWMGDRIHKSMYQDGLVIPVNQLETMLCDFHSMYRGHYYNGADIDMIEGQAIQWHVPRWVRDQIEAARLASLPEDYLGELRGQYGVRKELLKVYQKTGEVIDGRYERA